jgi:hypothetical protein
LRMVNSRLIIKVDPYDVLSLDISFTTDKDTTHRPNWWIKLVPLNSLGKQLLQPLQVTILDLGRCQFKNTIVYIWRLELFQMQILYKVNSVVGLSPGSLLITQGSFNVGKETITTIYCKLKFYGTNILKS